MNSAFITPEMKLARRSACHEPVTKWDTWRTLIGYLLFLYNGKKLGDRVKGK